MGFPEMARNFEASSSSSAGKRKREHLESAEHAINEYENKINEHKKRIEEYENKINKLKKTLGERSVCITNYLMEYIEKNENECIAKSNLIISFDSYWKTNYPESSCPSEEDFLNQLKKEFKCQEKFDESEFEEVFFGIKFKNQVIELGDFEIEEEMDFEIEEEIDIEEEIVFSNREKDILNPRQKKVLRLFEKNLELCDPSDKLGKKYNSTYNEENILIYNDLQTLVNNGFLSRREKYIETPEKKFIGRKKFVYELNKF